MKILCLTNWENSWINYWTKYIESRGHEILWGIGNKCAYSDIRDLYQWADAILSHWAVGWPNVITRLKLTKPLFVIHRSFECFNDTQFGMQIKDIDWSYVSRLFMLNESHYELFKKQVPGVQPTFIKNGIDIDEWPFVHRGEESAHNLAWIANINHKKGEMLAAHAVAEIQTIDSLVQLHHIGKIDSTRISLYLENIAPYLKFIWYSEGHQNKHGFVSDFLKDKKYIFSSSLVEGHPMNILEAMATGCKPLIHRYPGVEHQFPEKYIWSSFADLLRMYREPCDPHEYRSFIAKRYDYRITYKPIIDAIEQWVK